MQMKIAKDALLNVMERVANVANKGTMSEYAEKDRVTIIAGPKEATFKTSNGHMCLVTTVPVLGGEKGEPVTVTASTMLKIIRAIKTDKPDSEIVVDKDGDMLRIADPSSKKQKTGKLQVFVNGFDFNLKKPKGQSYTFDPGMMLRAIDRVTPFVCPLGYRVEYQMMLVHLFKNQVRFVCGDGGLFALFTYTPLNCKYEVADAEAGDQYLIPVNQALLLRQLLATSTQLVEITWPDKNELFIQQVDKESGKPVGHEVIQIKGIPNEPYIDYSQPAFQMDNAKVIIDLDPVKFQEGLNLVGAVRDKEIQESEKDFHGCDFIATPGNLNLAVKEGKYRCDMDVEATYYDLDKGKGEGFKTYYPFDFLNKICRACPTPTLRFYCIDEAGVMNAEAVECADANKDEHGVPQRIEETNNGDPRFHWFFCSALDEDEE